MTIQHEHYISGKYIDDENGLVSVSLLIYLFVRLANDLANGGALRARAFEKKLAALAVE